jgi:large subunit ribosomal protein L29
MKAVDLKDLSIQELKKRLMDEEENLANLRFQLATSQLESPIKVRTVRRDIARLKTVLRQKEGVEHPQAAETAAASANSPENTKGTKA